MRSPKVGEREFAPATSRVSARSQEPAPGFHVAPKARKWTSRGASARAGGCGTVLFGSKTPQTTQRERATKCKVNLPRVSRSRTRPWAFRIRPGRPLGGWDFRTPASGRTLPRRAVGSIDPGAAAIGPPDRTAWRRRASRVPSPAQGVDQRFPTPTGEGPLPRQFTQNGCRRGCREQMRHPRGHWSWGDSPRVPSRASGHGIMTAKGRFFGELGLPCESNRFPEREPSGRASRA